MDTTGTGAPGGPGDTEADDYALLDFGGGRKLERFGGAAVIRPAPAAEGPLVRDAPGWGEAAVEFVRAEGGGDWVRYAPLPEPWTVRSGGAEFELRTAAAGQVGLFPEQSALRRRVGELVREAAAERDAPLRVLDLFGYTGGSAIAAARAGAEVTLVDASRATVAWARRNFERNGLADAPIRSLAEDVPKFVAREVRRGNRYDAVLMDPPTFGRGPKREVWKIERDLDGLLAACRELLSPQPVLVLVTAHTEGWRMAGLAGRLERAMRGTPGTTSCGDLALSTRDGRRLSSGVHALKVMR